MIINLVYIGDHFYSKSKSLMSSIYKENEGGGLSRHHWGFVQGALKDGHEVHIRQATDAEFGHFSRKLAKIEEGS